MIAPGFIGVEEQLWVWMLAMIRPGAALFAAPVFGSASVPLQLRIILAIMIGITATGVTDFSVPTGDLATFSVLLFAIGEIIAGLAMGFALQIGYSSAFVAGELISNTMGLGFATMNDPLTGQPNPAIGRFLSIVAVLLLLAMDGHLMLIRIIIDSYTSLPPGNAFLSFEAFSGLARFGSMLFGLGLVIALPVGTALILIQLVMAMLARSAPQLNLFAVGLPVTLISGLVLLAIAAPVMAEMLMQAMSAGIERAAMLAGGGG